MKNLLFTLLTQEAANAIQLVNEITKLPEEKQKKYAYLLEKYQELIDTLREQFNKCQL